MSYLRTANERASYRKIFYPGTETYRNKLGILDRVKLEQLERHLTAARAEDGFPARTNHKAYRAFKAIHRPEAKAGCEVLDL